MEELQADRDSKAETTDKGALHCRICGLEWARREAVLPASRKAYMNPHGLVREIVLVSQVSNLRGDGEPHSEFSWFEGHTWEVHACLCGALAGWRFQGPACFWGLLVEAIA